MNRMKKITITAGLALALTVGLGTTAKSAWAGYLSAPTLSTTSGQFQFTINGTTEYATSNSSFGNTIPTVSALNGLTGSSYVGPTLQDGTGGTNATVPTFFSTTGLDLQFEKSMTSSYSIGGITTGDVISNVYAVGKNANMPDAVPGELVFTYQFDVTGTVNNNNKGINAASLGFFNNPNGTLFNLGSGILANSVSGPNFSNTTYVNSSGNTVPLTELNLSAANLQGNVSFANNNSISNLSYSLLGTNIPFGYYTPQFFVASNAFYSSMGTVGISGSAGSDTVAIFVPGTPEPKTLILFGSGIALLAFIFRRKQENTLSI